MEPITLRVHQIQLGDLIPLGTPEVHYSVLSMRRCPDHTRTIGLATPDEPFFEALAIHLHDGVPLTVHRNTQA
jgi:hypothetical protein